MNQGAAYLATGESPVRIGNRHPSIARYETLRCEDGWLAIACGNDRQFVRLCEVVGAPGLSSDPRLTTNDGGVRHRPALVNILEDQLSTRSAADWQERLTIAGVPASEVGDTAHGFELASGLGLQLESS